MNTILVTYDTRQDGSSDVEHCLIEPALIAVEMLRGNVYVPGSIKDVRERGKGNE
mgnify:CR=1 FL=1